MVNKVVYKILLPADLPVNFW